MGNDKDYETGASGPTPSRMGSERDPNVFISGISFSIALQTWEMWALRHRGGS